MKHFILGVVATVALIAISAFCTYSYVMNHYAVVVDFSDAYFTVR